MNANDFDRGVPGDEWDAQEQARHDEQRGAENEQSAPMVQQYRMIARAIRSAPLDPVPDDFAERTARRIEELTRAGSERFETTLQLILVAILIVVGVASIFIFGSGWLTSLSVQLHLVVAQSTSSGGWVFLGTLCLVVSTAFDFWRADRVR